MAAREGVGSRFDAACAHAARYLKESKPDTANLIWIASNPTAAFPSPGPNTDFLTEELQQCRPLPEHGALPAAFDLALSQLATTQGNREVLVISDFQASAWRDFKPGFPADVTLHAHRVASMTPPNLAVTRLLAQPANPVAGQDVTLLAQVRNFSADPVSTQLTLDAGGARQSQPLTLSPWGTAEAAFTIRPAAAGPLPITAAITPDAFPLDDSRHTVAVVHEALELAITSPAKDPTAELLERLASALTWLETTRSPSQTPDFHFLTAWDGSNPEALTQAAARGTTVIVKPSPNCPQEAVASLLACPTPAGPGTCVLDTNPTGWTAALDADHPATRLFQSGEFGNPFAGSFRERLKPTHPWLHPDLRPIATYADGIPALLERPTNNAPILLWNLPLDLAKTDWPARSPFVPLMGELFLHTRPRPSSEAAFTLPGSKVTWTSADPAHTGALRLLNPDQSPAETTESTAADGTRWEAALPAVPGLYQWQVSAQPVAYTAVNFPEPESDLRPLDATPAFGKLTQSSDALVRRAALARGIPLWPWLVLAALALLATEAALPLKQAASTPARPTP